MAAKTIDDSYHRTGEESPEELSSGRVIVDVLQAVADEKDVDLVDLPPLAERIDSDTLRCLINHSGDPYPVSRSGSTTRAGQWSSGTTV